MAIKHPENNVVDKSAKAKLNWNIGKIIITNTKYGAKFADNLSRDIFIGVPGYSGLFYS